MSETAISADSRRTRTLVEGALCVALSVVFSCLKLFHMPQGGSITLEMAPLLYYSYKYGAGWGISAGVISGIVQALFGGYVVHPVQGILDYPAAFGALGIAGLFGQSARGVIIGTAAAAAARLVCHVASGVIFFSSYAPEGQNALVYSVVYNATFMAPSAIISAAAAWFLWKKFLANR
jgi:thiamine transporter